MPGRAVLGTKPLASRALEPEAFCAGCSDRPFTCAKRANVISLVKAIAARQPWAQRQRLCGVAV